MSAGTVDARARAMGWLVAVRAFTHWATRALLLVAPFLSS
jgi:hypothetical protein